MATVALLILGSYLWGALPSAYLVARHFKGIDIREYGSGNVGASNLVAHVGIGWAVVLGTFDSIGKGTLPVVVAWLMDESLGVRGAVGVAAVVGHNWSPYIRFTGGRGVATGIGVILGLFMWRESLTGAFLVGVMGRLISRDTAFWTFVGTVTLPGFAYLYGEPTEIILTSAALSLAIILKRLVANWMLPLDHRGLARVMVFRLLWDRDVARRKEWMTRVPTSRDGEGR